MATFAPEWVQTSDPMIRSLQETYMRASARTLVYYLITTPAMDHQIQKDNKEALSDEEVEPLLEKQKPVETVDQVEDTS